MSVEITDEQDVPLDRQRIESTLLEGLQRAGAADSEVSVLLTDDARMTELNRTYRDLSETTDVLSFGRDESDGFPFDHVLGDIVVSIPTAQRQAEEAGHSLQEEVDFLLLHGLLHLLGHDHEKDGWETWNRALEEIRPNA